MNLLLKCTRILKFLIEKCTCAPMINNFTNPGPRPRPLHGGTTVSENHEVYPTFICLQVPVPFRERMDGAFWEIESIVRTVRPISTSKWVRVVINKIPHQLLALIKCLSAVDFLPRDPHTILQLYMMTELLTGQRNTGDVCFFLLLHLPSPLSLSTPFFFFIFRWKFLLFCQFVTSSVVTCKVVNGPQSGPSGPQRCSMYGP